MENVVELPVKSTIKPTEKGASDQALRSLVLVEYANKKSKNIFLGQIVSKDGSEIEVTFLHAKEISTQCLLSQL